MSLRMPLWARASVRLGTPLRRAATRSSTTDNSFLKVLVEQGALGFLAYTAGLVGMLALAGARLRRAPPQAQLLGLAALSGFVGFVLLETAGEYIEQPGQGARVAAPGNCPRRGLFPEPAAGRSPVVAGIQTRGTWLSLSSPPGGDGCRGARRRRHGDGVHPDPPCLVHIQHRGVPDCPRPAREAKRHCEMATPRQGPECCRRHAGHVANRSELLANRRRATRADRPQALLLQTSSPRRPRPRARCWLPRASANSSPRARPRAPLGSVRSRWCWDRGRCRSSPRPLRTSS